MLKVLGEKERGVIFRLGQVTRVVGPGLVWYAPVIDRLVIVDLERALPGWRALSKGELEERIRAIVVQAPARAPTHPDPDVAEAIELSQAAAGRERFGIWMVIVVFGLSFPPGLLAAYLVMRSNQLDQERIFLDSLAYSVPLALGYTALAWAALRKLRRRRLLRTLLVGTLLGFPVAGFAYTALLNRWLDDKPHATHTVRVISRETGRVNGEPWYYVRVRSWRRPGGTETLAVAVGEYERVVPQRGRMIVVAKPGRLGYEWVVSYAVVGER